MDDILETNEYISNDHHQGTYGVQRDLSHFLFENHLERERNKVMIGHDDLHDQDDPHDDDLLLTNPINPAPINPSMGGRVTREVRELINIDSSQRQMTQAVIVPRNATTGEYDREVISNGESLLMRYTVDDLNSEFSPTDNDLQFPYEQRGADIYYVTYLDRYPSSYTVHLSKTFTNVKSIRLVETIVPNTLWTINDLNGLIILDIIDEDVFISDEDRQNGVTNSIDYINVDYPFLTIQIPEGKYVIGELITIIQETINTYVEEHTESGFTKLFTVTYNSQTEEIKFTLNQPSGRNLQFHLRFWEDSTLPNYLFLYAMLGFKESQTRDQDGDEVYVTNKTNVVDHGAAKMGHGQRISRPYRKIELAPVKYIYLGLEGYPTMTDTQKQLDWMAKVHLSGEPGGTEYNTYVGNPVVFTNPIPQLTTLKIRWYNPGNSHQLVDFGYREHSFTLELARYVDDLQENQMSTHRGIVDLTSYSTAITAAIR